MTLIVNKNRKITNNLEKPIPFHFFLFTANELHNWVLYYSVPCLMGILPEDYLLNFILFVEALDILLQRKIESEDLKLARQLLKRFHMFWKSLYGTFF